MFDRERKPVFLPRRRALHIIMYCLELWITEYTAKSWPQLQNRLSSVPILRSSKPDDSPWRVTGLSHDLFTQPPRYQPRGFVALFAGRVNLELWTAEKRQGEVAFNIRVLNKSISLSLVLFPHPTENSIQPPLNIEALFATNTSVITSIFSVYSSSSACEGLTSLPHYLPLPPQWTCLSLRRHPLTRSQYKVINY